MDNEKIGKFILELRKQKGMTQKELAEKVGVSDKTISKWECGNSIPDITYLESLCNSLSISVNELLSGERLTGASYSEKAEENIMALMKENKSNKVSDFWKIVLGMALIFLCFFFLIIAYEGMLSLRILTNFYDLPTLLAYLLLCVGSILLTGKKTKVEKLSFLQKVLVPNGLLISLFLFVFILMAMDDLSKIGPRIAGCILALIYSMVAYLIVTVLKVRCENEV